jgi:hypothetical protein
MKLPAIALCALWILLPGATLAADEPEVVYGKFHRAAMAGDLEEMLKHGPAQRRAEIQGMSESSKDAALKMAKFMMPRAFTVERRLPASAGRATLIVSGPGDGGTGSGNLRTIYGTVIMVAENGIWKVDEASWSTERPAVLGAAPPAGARTVADKSQGKAPAAAPKASPPGTIYLEPPTRKLGAAKPECVFKPVMTAQDLENCK